MICYLKGGLRLKTELKLVIRNLEMEVTWTLNSPCIIPGFLISVIGRKGMERGREKGRRGRDKERGRGGERERSRNLGTVACSCWEGRHM